MIGVPLAFAIVAGFAGVWVWAEFRAGAALRLASGAVLACSVACAAYYVGWLAPQYTISFYDYAVRQSATALEEGQLDVVRQAFADYTSQSAPHPRTILARLEKAATAR
jgi:hypothetical protein